MLHFVLELKSDRRSPPRPNYSHRSRQPRHLKERVQIGVVIGGVALISFAAGFLAKGITSDDCSVPPATPTGTAVPAWPTETKTPHPTFTVTSFPTTTPLPTSEPKPTKTETEQALLDMENVWGHSRLSCTYAVDAEGAMSSCDSRKLAAQRIGAPEGAIVVNGHEVKVEPGTVAEVKFEIWPNNGGFTIIYQGVAPDRVQDVITYTRFTGFKSDGKSTVIQRDGASAPFNTIEGTPIDGISVGLYNTETRELTVTVTGGFGGFALTPERTGALVSGIRVDRANLSPFTGDPLP